MLQNFSLSDPARHGTSLICYVLLPSNLLNDSNVLQNAGYFCPHFFLSTIAKLEAIVTFPGFLLDHALTCTWSTYSAYG